MIAKMVAACAFEAIFLYTTELYPTEIRTQGMMASIMLSRAGGMASPFILDALVSEREKEREREIDR